MYEQRANASRSNRFRRVRPQPVPLAAADTAPAHSSGLPLVVGPDRDGVKLADFAADRQEWIDEKLAAYGGVLFRGFGVTSAEAFEAVSAVFCTELYTENGEHTPVMKSGHVQTPVLYPQDRQLLWHNENSFNATWPRRIVFCCLQPADQGGETSLVDGRQVFARLDPQLRRRFTERGVMYRRSYQAGIGLTWQQVFRTGDRALVERRCREERFRYEWLAGDRLRTTCVRPAAVAHPDSGELCWFTQAQHWHPSCLDPATRRALTATFGEDDLPRDCRYGDGSPISDAEMAQILDAYRELEVALPWRVGDVLLVDNVATAHGRNPYQGSRELLVALGDPQGFPEPGGDRPVAGIREP